MSFTDTEKMKIRHHLGFLNVQAAQTFVLGVPAGVQTQYIIEGAMDRVLAAAESQARLLLARCDAIEAQIGENQDVLFLSQTEEVSFRDNEFELLMKRYQYWRNGLANVLGVYPNPFDKRFVSMSGGGGVNAKVSH